MGRFALSVVAFLTLMAAGCGGTTMEEAAAPPPQPPQAETGGAAGSPDRPPAPPIDGVSLDGERIALDDYRGRAVLINVWSSW